MKKYFLEEKRFLIFNQLCLDVHKVFFLHNKLKRKYKRNFFSFFLIIIFAANHYNDPSTTYLGYPDNLLRWTGRICPASPPAIVSWREGQILFPIPLSLWIQTQTGQEQGGQTVKKKPYLCYMYTGLTRKVYLDSGRQNSASVCSRSWTLYHF